MSWYENVAGVRVVTRHSLSLIAELNRQKREYVKLSARIDQLLDDKYDAVNRADFFEKELYEEWDKTSILGNLNYTATLREDTKDLTMETFRTLEITPKKVATGYIMNSEMYDYIKRDIKFNIGYIDNMIDKCLVCIKDDLKKQVIYAIEK